MVLSVDELSGLVEKYDQTESYTIPQNPNQILFNLKDDNEVLVSINLNSRKDGKILALGQYRKKGQSGFGEASSIMPGDTELEAVEAVIDKVLGYDLQKKNR